ncbi:MAG: Holliday junction resolvase RuvX [Candidatus Omnitrophica bacterium]|nr:Holliday junction resolvase RuvX [Candidatus Omnitrophota bacterium]MCM8777316.1 Holliday junction resolvase RuvX [Candidatus Omnitrophota bacterium]
MRILCLDVGGKRVGVAVSDETKTLARGLGQINRGDKEIAKIKEIIERYEVETIVYGLPLRMDGSISSQTEKTIAFIEELKKEITVPFIPFDERLSSQQAETILLQADLSRRKRKKYIDKLSAQIILQNYLDSLKEDTIEM